MAIKGKTGRDLAGRVNDRNIPLGKLVKGEKQAMVDDKGRAILDNYGNQKYKMVDLEYFRFVSDRPGVAEIFTEIYGDQPTSIPVMMPFATPEQLFENSSWFEEYTGSQKSGRWTLIHRCDGEHVVRTRNKDGGYTDYAPGTGPVCPYVLHPELRTTKNPGCGQIARLLVVLPELILRTTFGYVVVQTHATYDIPHINGALYGVYEQIKSVHPNGLAGSRWTLSRQWQHVNISYMLRGERIFTADDKSLLRLDVDPQWISEQYARLAATMLPTAPVAALPAPEVLAFQLADDIDEVIGAEDAGFSEGDFTTTEATVPAPTVTQATTKDIGVNTPAGVTWRAAMPALRAVRQDLNENNIGKIVSNSKLATLPTADNWADWLLLYGVLRRANPTATSVEAVAEIINTCDIIVKANELPGQWAPLWRVPSRDANIPAPLFIDLTIPQLQGIEENGKTPFTRCAANQVRREKEAEAALSDMATAEAGDMPA